MYRAIALFEHGNEDHYAKVQEDMLVIINLKMMQQKDQEV
jgi:hypothetical protein